MGPEIIGLASSVLGITCGIVAVVSSSIVKVKKMNNERRIRESIIANNVDPETARQLVTPEEKQKKNPYAALQWGCALLGLALGYLFTLLLNGLFGVNINEDSLPFWIILSAGVGIGLLSSFAIKLNMESKKDVSDRQEN
ncbi:hypothetical protein HMPREF9135_0387 [Segatella baroniae F0067]|uniref:Uncharacterized protein n=1 Tax=Segatella baroniae F0067 TaxID=1115809 RepID=U2QFI9_9BACT|nr:hypothetical protein [Segatella baroniae]ERK40078.1 hypothetical protein HMPREF9135_0387 [Segatella baroniae F0067]